MGELKSFIFDNVHLVFTSCISVGKWWFENKKCHLFEMIHQIQVNQI